MDPVIQVSQVSKAYGRQDALRGISFEVRPGRIVGIVGPNGSGKTTTINAMVGLTDFKGDLNVLGLDPRTHRDQLMHDVAFVADVAVLPRWIKVNQLINLMEGVHPKFDRKRAEHFLGFTKISLEAKVKSLSKGTVAQLHLALVMAIDAKVLILDEPTLGLDVLYRKQFYRQLMEDYADDSRTIIMSTHQIDEIEHVITDLIFINDGHVILSATKDELEDRFIEVVVDTPNSETSVAFKAIDDRVVFGRRIMMFDGVPLDSLKSLGECRRPSLSDIFVAAIAGDQK